MDDVNFKTTDAQDEHHTATIGLGDGETPFESSSPEVDPRDIKILRHELRSVLEEIFGCCELILDKNGARLGSVELQHLGAIQAVAEVVRAVLDASASVQSTNRSLRDFGHRLKQLGSRIGFSARQLLADLPSNSNSELTSDLTQLGGSSQALISVVNELVEYHLLKANEGSRWVSTVAVSVSGQGSVTPLNGEARAGAGRILIADDNEANRRLLARRLEREGYQTTSVADGSEVLGALALQPADLILLDVDMPGLGGLGVLQILKGDSELKDIPVIVVSAVEDIASIAACIEHGADDYLPKPVEAMILKARVRSSVENGRLREQEKRRTAELKQALDVIEHERRVSEKLLMNILPDEIADELRRKDSVEPRYYEDVTIMFTDFAGFTLSSTNISAEDLVMALHAYFTEFDRIAQHYNLEKLKTIGDSYLCVGGMPARSSSHPVDAVLAALEMVRFGRERARNPENISWPIRVGLHTGPVIAGVVGIHKFAFDIWGESVNFASRIEAGGKPDTVNISERTYARVKDFFVCEYRGRLQTKDGQEADMYMVESVSPRLMGDNGSSFQRRYRTYFRRDPPVLLESAL